jgi:predicted HAD superfamily Cof-like phosphohydrolase
MSAQPEYTARPDDADFDMRVNDLIEATKRGRTITMADGHVGQEAIRRMKRQIELAKATTEQESPERHAAYEAIVGPEVELKTIPNWENPHLAEKAALWGDPEFDLRNPYLQETDFLGYRRSTGQMVREFRKAFGQETPERPTVVEAEKVQEMLKWIVFGTFDHETGELTDSSEFDELLTALADNDIVGIADALADTVYLWHQFAAMHGIDLDKVLAEVHRSNMSKLGSDGNPVYYSNSTKIAKGPNYSPPNISKALDMKFDEEDGVWK